MKIKIEKVQPVGQAQKIAMLIDDCVVPMNYDTSRRLTETASEEGSGIFTAWSCQVEFRRNDASVCVSFAPINYDASAREILETILMRAKQVRDAFNEKYPHIVDVYEVEFEPFIA